jgi:hypothetical protein
MLARTSLRTATPLAAFALVAATAGAAVSVVPPDTDLRCRLVKEDIIDPGLSLEGASGGFYTPTPGNLTCQGTIGGRQADPKALGRFLEKGEYGTKDPDSCLAGEGKGIFGATIPTERGTARISVPFTFTFGELPLRGGVVGGRLQGDGVIGFFDVIPLAGDCVFTPVTKIYTIDEIIFSSPAAAWQFDER